MNQTSKRSRSLVLVAAVAVLYVAGGTLGAALRFTPDQSSIVWPPAGIAFAWVLLFGPRMAFGVWVGGVVLAAYLSWLDFGHIRIEALWIDLPVELGSVAQCLLGAFLVRRYANFLHRPGDGTVLLRAMLLAAPVSCFLSAAIGMLGMYAAGFVAAQSFCFEFLVHWAGESLGVLLFAPPILLLFDRSPGLTRRRRVAQALVPSVAVAAALCFHGYVLVSAQGQLKESFQALVRVLSSQLNQEARALAESLIAFHTLFARPSAASEVAFDTLAQRAMGLRPGLQAIYWTPRVIMEKRGQWESAAAQGLPHLIVERDAQGYVRSAAERAEYLPIERLRSLADAPPPLGFDLASEPQIARCVAANRLQSGAFASSVLRPADDPYFWLLQAVHRDEPDAAGYVVFEVRLADLVEPIIGGVDRDHVVVQIVDAAESSPRLLYSSDGAKAPRDSGATPFIHNAQLQFPGRQWVVSIYGAAPFAQQHGARADWYASLAGLVLSGVVGCFFLIAVGRAARIEVLLGEVSRGNALLRDEIDERQAVAAALRESEARFRGLAENLREVFSITDWTDTKPKVLYVSPSVVEMFGVTSEADIYADFYAWQSAVFVEDQAALEASFVARRRGDAVNLEYRLQLATGQVRWVWARHVPRRNDAARLIYYSVVEDVTERKAYEIGMRTMNAELEARVAARTEALAASKANQRALMQALPDIVLRIDDQGQVLEVSDAPGHSLREHARALCGRQLHELFPTTSSASAQRAMRRVAQGSTLESFDFDVSLETLRFHYEVRLLRSGADEFVAIVRDMTAQYRSREALRESEQRFRHFADSIEYIVWMMAPDRRSVIFVSRGFEPVFGRPRQEFVIDPAIWFAAVDPAHRERVLAAAEALPSAGIYREDYPIRRGDGDQRWLRETAIAVRGDHGVVQMLVGIAEDITERRAAELRVRELTGELEQRVRLRTAELEYANREMESFSYSVSHDLRAPLRQVDGYVRAMVEDRDVSLGDAERMYLHRVRLAVARMETLIDAMLRFAQVARQSLRLSQVDLSALAREVVERVCIPRPGQVTEIDIGTGIGGIGDAKLLELVLQNLIGNAWKFTAQRVLARIEFSAWRKGDETTYCVRDNGVGFDMEYAGQLFGAFQRLHDAAQFEGTGIGLATVRRVINRHGGRVWASGEVDRGASFYFTLGPQHAEPERPD
jgi:PAS domain S-box-containing protein